MIYVIITQRLDYTSIGRIRWSKFLTLEYNRLHVPQTTCWHRKWSSITFEAEPFLARAQCPTPPCPFTPPRVVSPMVARYVYIPTLCRRSYHSHNQGQLRTSQPEVPGRAVHSSLCLASFVWWYWILTALHDSLGRQHYDTTHLEVNALQDPPSELCVGMSWA